MFRQSTQEKIRVFTKNTKKGQIPQEITDSEVQAALKKYFTDYTLKIIPKPKSQYYSHLVIAKPKNKKASQQLKDMGIKSWLTPKLKFAYSTGQSLMFRMDLPPHAVYPKYIKMFDKIAADMKLVTLKPFSKNSLIFIKGSKRETDTIIFK